jgi:hypothetical protein
MIQLRSTHVLASLRSLHRQKHRSGALPGEHGAPMLSHTIEEEAAAAAAAAAAVLLLLLLEGLACVVCVFCVRARVRQYMCAMLLLAHHQRGGGRRRRRGGDATPKKK